MAATLFVVACVPAIRIFQHAADRWRARHPYKPARSRTR